MSSTPPKSIPARIFGVMSGFGLATILLLILMLLTWLATLEIAVSGLHQTLGKYFHYSKLYVLPDAAVFSEKLVDQDKYLPPLPGGFWVCALLVLNLTLGGIIRMRKGVRTIGVLIAHFGIIFMIIAGGVAQLKEERGVMMMSETGIEGLPSVSDYAQNQIDTTVEVLEVKDGKATNVHFVEDRYYKDLEADKQRIIRIPSLPFDLELTRYLQNCKPMAGTSMAPGKGEPVVDGWFLLERDANKDSELDTPGIHARALMRDGAKGETFLLTVPDPMEYTGIAAPPRPPFTLRVGDRTFAIRMEKQVWAVPFKLRLMDARTEYYPHTTKPKFYESDVMRIEEGRESKVFVEMNAPMRFGGWTAYQHTMPPSITDAKGDAIVSGFEIVRNPSDQWPKYAIFIAGFGLVLHFMMKLVNFASRGAKPPRSNPTPTQD